MDDTDVEYGQKTRVRRRPNKRMSSVNSSTNLKKYKVDGAVMINQYKVLRDLGKGAFGKVVLAIDTQKNSHAENLYAIKIMNKKELKA